MKRIPVQFEEEVYFERRGMVEWLDLLTESVIMIVKWFMIIWTGTYIVAYTLTQVFIEHSQEVCSLLIK